MNMDERLRGIRAGFQLAGKAIQRFTKGYIIWRVSEILESDRFHVTASPQSSAVRIYFPVGCLPDNEKLYEIRERMPASVLCEIRETNNFQLFRK